MLPLTAWFDALCDGCGTSPVIYRDDTNVRYRCQHCHETQAPMTTKIETAELFTTYTEALKASEQALVGANTVADQVLSVKVETDAQAQWAADIGRQVAQVRKDLEQRRDIAKAPWYQAYTTIQRAAKPAIDRFLQVEKHLKLEIGSHQHRKYVEQAAQLTAATSPEEIARTIEATTTRTEGVQTRGSWTYEVVDESAIPREFWVLDTDRLARLARAEKQNLSIPGIRPVREATVAWSGK